MNIIFDIGHPAHVNFFRNVIERLRREGHKVQLTVLSRGRLPVIAKDVFPDIPIKIVGKHRGSKWSVLVEANVMKFFRLLSICLRLRPDIGISAGSFTLGAAMKLVNKPNLQFDDDPERKLNVFLEKITSTKLFFPIFYTNNTPNVFSYNALKEWAYLSPQYFQPNENVLKLYDLKPKQYIFIREVSVGSLNYSDQRAAIISHIVDKMPSDIPVILSLEEKRLLGLYPPHWKLLKEPVEDIHSLIYYSRVLISSGDSMAREGAMLGVPSVYCGVREMAANMIMISEGLLFHQPVHEVPKFILNAFQGAEACPDQAEYRNSLQARWIDVSDFIYKQIVKINS